MKKVYVDMVLEVVFMSNDVIRTSQFDNVVDLPEFPESFFN